MSIAINLSPTLTDQLQNQATTLNISLNELIKKLIYKGLSKKTQPKSQAEAVSSEMIDAPATHNVAKTASKGRLTMAEIVAKARARPRNPNSIHPPTGTVDDVLAKVAAESTVPRLTPEEWEKRWWPIYQETKK